MEAVLEVLFKALVFLIEEGFALVVAGAGFIFLFFVLVMFLL